MKRQTALLVVVLLVSSAGCSNGTTPAPDPFFGRITISPPSTQMGTGGSSYVPSRAASSYAPPAVVATPVNPNHLASTSDSSWPSPPPPNFRPGSSSTVSPGSIASRSQPTRPIYLSQAAIEDSVRSPSYSVATSNPRYGGSASQASSAPIAAAGSGRATTFSPRQIYPAPNLQALFGRRIASIPKLCKEVSAWADSSNKKRRGVDWQFTIEKARIKLKSLYPIL